MRVLRLFYAAALGMSVAALAASPDPTVARDTLNKYCVGCHSQRLKIGGLVLENFDSAQVASHPEVWEKVAKKLRARTMPPAGNPRPDAATYNNVATLLETTLDLGASAHPFAGRPVLHRMNRVEYANAIRDLLALDVDVTSLLPPDDSAFGFDNISDMLGVSPALQENYLKAAIKIAALAVGDPTQPPANQTWRIRQDLSQNVHVDGTPFGTVGGTAVEYNFPRDGSYVLSAKLYRTNLNIMRGLQTEHQVDFSIDGKRVYATAIGGAKDLASMFDKPTDTGDAVDARLRFEVPVTAGPHIVAVAFLRNAQFAEPVRLQSFERSSVDNFDWAGHPHFQQLTVTGPFTANSTEIAETPARKQIFVCRPSKALSEQACARKIVAALLPRAFRQPATTADIDRVMKFYEAGRRDGDFDAGVQGAVERILASPKFLFRAEKEPANLAAGSLYKVSDTELASRLSFFLWSSIPDARLLDLASKGQLKQSAVLEREARRMLADSKAEALVKNFAGQWLQLRNLRNVQPNTDQFPDFDDNLRQAFRTETEMLFTSILREDRNVLDLMTADYTFVNERLAKHYGIAGVYGSRFRRVPVAQEERKGLLGQGSILALTSHAERTSVVVRGKWILENLLGQQVPPPPADVPPLKEKQDGERPRTMREQMAEHRANPVCASCHKTLDPIGFAMENFDAVGAWRTNDSGNAIDASGELADGTRINGVVELRKALLDRPETFVGVMTEKMLTYALGRGLDPRDLPEVRAIVRKAGANQYKFSSLVLGIVTSTPFRMNTALGQGVVAVNGAAMNGFATNREVIQ